MIYSKDLANSDTDESDVRTAKVLNQIANKLEPNIQMTYDVPSLHADKKMPVLDLKVWVEDNKVKYTFKKKEVSSKYTMMKRLALSDSVKRDTCFMEAVRRILNMSDNLTSSKTITHLNEFSVRCNQ